MSTLKTVLTFIIGLAVGGGGAYAFVPGMTGSMDMKMEGTAVDHSKMDHGTEATISAASSSNDAYKIAMDKMMAEMMVPYTGNADVDFAKGMIPHHQGAIDMAKVVLQFGKDPELRKLAEGVVAAQESEISFMQNWLKANDK